MEFFGGLFLAEHLVAVASVVLVVDITTEEVAVMAVVAVATAMAVAAVMAAVVDTERPQMKDIISYLKKTHELK